MEVARKIEVTVGSVLSSRDASEDREATNSVSGGQVEKSSTVVANAPADRPAQRIQATWGGPQLEVELVTRGGDERLEGGERRLSTASFVCAHDTLSDTGSISELGLCQVCSLTCRPQQKCALLHDVQYSGSSLSSVAWLRAVLLVGLRAEVCVDRLAGLVVGVGP